MVVMMMVAADRLRQVLDIGELAALGGVLEVGGELVKLGSRRRIAVRCGGLGGALQIGGDLLRDLLILGRIRLLELLESAHQLSEGGKLAIVGLLRRRQLIDAAQTVVGVASRQAGVLQHAAEDRLQVAVRERVYGTGAHALVIGTSGATL